MIDKINFNSDNINDTNLIINLIILTSVLPISLTEAAKYPLAFVCFFIHICNSFCHSTSHFVTLITILSLKMYYLKPASFASTDSCIQTKKRRSKCSISPVKQV
jgi:hypothetical protein